jgi:type III restriction/modification enzyme restriction subunit
MILRRYQEECRDAVLSDLTSHRAVAAVMATGAGKTPTAIAIMQALPGPALVLAHRGELLTQAAEKMAAFGIAPELEKADARASLDAPVLESRDRFRGYPPEHALKGRYNTSPEQRKIAWRLRPRNGWHCSR